MIRSEQLVLAEWFMHLISIRIGLNFILKERWDFFFKELNKKRITETSEKIKDANILFISLHLPNKIASTTTTGLF